VWTLQTYLKGTLAQQLLNLNAEDVEWVARWNIAPTDEIATVRQDRKTPERIFANMRWGLIH
jgi:putative SOS response-associated peptidase YedK